MFGGPSSGKQSSPATPQANLSDNRDRHRHSSSGREIEVLG